MNFIKLLYALIFVASFYVLVECRSYNNGLIFYDLENKNIYLPPTVSVSRGRGLAKLKYSSRGSIWSTFGKPCNCKGPLCACCVGIKVKQFSFDQKMCANVSYALPRDEIQLEVILNDTSTAKYGIAARNPSPLCVPIMMGIPMSMCIQMSNIAVQGDNLNMCMDFLVRLASTELFEMHFQCMKVGLQGASWVGPDGQPVIPANEGKIIDKSAMDSQEYYDESEMEEENEIVSKEKSVQNILKDVEEDSLNKAEEETYYNDITEKIMDIVKEKEQEDDESLKKNIHKAAGPLQDNKKVEQIVTNIMDSINQANAEEEMNGVIETSAEMDGDQNEINLNSESDALSGIVGNEENKFSLAIGEDKLENIQKDIEVKIKTELEILKNVSKEEHKEYVVDTNTSPEDTSEKEWQSLRQETNADDEIEDNDEKQILNSVNENKLLTQDMQLENHTDHFKETTKESTTDWSIIRAAEKNKKPFNVLDESTTRSISDDENSLANEKFEILSESQDDTEISKNVSEQHGSLNMFQHTMESSTEDFMAANIRPDLQQDATTTSAIANINSKENSLITGAVMTTIIKTKATASNKPIISKENTIVAETLNKNNDGDKEDDDDQDEDNENSDGDDDDDNSHENDSDYEGEESEETEDDIKETESNSAATIIMANVVEMNNANAIQHKKYPTKQKLPNESGSNESHANENTSDEFETEEGESLENAESNEQHENDSEEDYDGDEFEDYEATTVTIRDKKPNSDNNACCKHEPSSVSNNSHVYTNNNDNNAEIPQIDTASTNNLQVVSNSNSMISNTDDDINALNVVADTNKMSQIISSSAGTATATTTTSSNIIPLPLARKLYSLHQQLTYRRSRQQQHYV